jgi:hypothetical protein
MYSRKIDAVKLKRQLQRKAENRLTGLSEKEQLELLRKKFGHLKMQKRG